MRTAASLTGDQLRILQQCALDEAFTGRAAIIHAKQFEKDGRKRTKVIREAVEFGLIGPCEGESYKVSPSILETIEMKNADLYEIWKSKFDQHESNRAYAQPWVCVDSLPLAVQRTVSLASGVDWYVVSTTPYEYYATFSDKPEHVIDGTHSSAKFSAYWAGPFDLESAKEKLRSTVGTCIAVSSSSMRQAVNSFLNEQTLDWQFANNALWGLVKLGIIPEGELFTPDNKMRIDPQFHEGEPLRPSGTHCPKSPTEVTWDSNLTDSIQRLRDQIERKMQQLDLLRRIGDGIDKYGGWEAFKTDFRTALRDELTRNAHQRD